jgi:uncharacterized protein (TIGR02145 family)
MIFIILIIAMVFTFSCFSGVDKVNSISSYRTVQIGSQIWMAENLNYAVEGSVCYDNLESNCDKYGRLYNWATAMNLDLSCNFITCASQIQLKHQGICPAGWHIPGNTDWDQLYLYVSRRGTCPSGQYFVGYTKCDCFDDECSNECDYSAICYDDVSDIENYYEHIEDEYIHGYQGMRYITDIGKYLKAKKGWYNHVCGPRSGLLEFYACEQTCGPSDSDNDNICEDNHGFSALPGGSGHFVSYFPFNASGGSWSSIYANSSDLDFSRDGNFGYWWSASEIDSSFADNRFILGNYDNAYWSEGNKNDDFFSVRCVKD